MADKKTNQQRGKMAKRKGKAFELQIANHLKSHGWTMAARSAQIRGKTNGLPDVINGPKGIHLELKHQEKMRLYEWVNQSVNDAESQKSGFPAVIHKQNKRAPLITMQLDDFLNYIKMIGGGPVDSDENV